MLRSFLSLARFTLIIARASYSSLKGKAGRVSCNKHLLLVHTYSIWKAKLLVGTLRCSITRRIWLAATILRIVSLNSLTSLSCSSLQWLELSIGYNRSKRAVRYSDIHRAARELVDPYLNLSDGIAQVHMK